MSANLGGQNTGADQDDAHKQKADEGNTALLTFHCFSCSD
jgi:hypothetical protein